MWKITVLLIIIFLLFILEKAICNQKFRTFFEYYSAGCRLYELDKRNLTLQDYISEKEDKQMLRQCSRRLYLAQQFVVKNGLYNPVDETKEGIALTEAKDSFFMGCSLLEAIKMGIDPRKAKSLSRAEFEPIYLRCLKIMREGITVLSDGEELTDLIKRP